jgi:hypothetical protein
VPFSFGGRNKKENKNMIAYKSGGTPIHPGYLAKIAEPRPFGTSPFRGYVPIRQFRGGNPYGLRGLKGGCGCGPSGGACSCPGMGAYDPGRGVFAKPGMGGLGQNTSLDQIIANGFNWLGGVVQANLPGSAAVPPQYGSTGAIGTQLMQWLPYIVGGILVYKLIK